MSMDREEDENWQFFLHITQDKTPQEVARKDQQDPVVITSKCRMISRSQARVPFFDFFGVWRTTFACKFNIYSTEESACVFNPVGVWA